VPPVTARTLGGRRLAWLVLLAAAVGVVAAAGVVASAAAGPSATRKGEGALDLLEWPSFSDQGFARAFEKQTGCSIHRRDVGSSNQMVALMDSGGGGKVDLVSAAGDIAQELVAAHDVSPIDVRRIPGYTSLMPAFRSPASTTVGGVHYGVAVEWVPNLLLYDPERVRPAPSSWAVLYDRAYRGKIAVPNNPLQIADAALYLMSSKRSLGIRDPYELTKTQFDAAVSLLQQQKLLVGSYWNYAADEVSAFRDGHALVGTGWPYQVLTLRSARAPIASVLPREGATGWIDSWLLAAKAPHPKCASLWLAYVTKPQVQAKLAVALGETPTDRKACAPMNALQPGSCAGYHLATASRDIPRIRFWKTPTAACGFGGRRDCVPLVEWQKAWARLGS
jgi:putative spermidine/putrescine transport system substrate-binding protein